MAKQSSVSGVDDVKKRLKRLATTVPTATDQALIDLGKELLQTATQNAPRDTGELQDSGYTQVLAPGVVRIGFKAPHAAAVHERLDLHHASGSPKFLERAITEGKSDAIDTLAKAANDALEAESV